MAKQETPRRISDVAPAEEVIKPVYKAEDHMEEDFYITGFDVRTGTLGKFYIIDAVHVDTKAECVISTGSWMVDKQLQALDPRLDLPLLIRFVPKDRSYYMV